MKSIPISDITKPKLKKLYIDDNLTIDQIGKIMGRGSSTIHRKIKKFNLTKNKTTVYDQINQTRKAVFLKKYGREHYMQSEKGFKQHISKLLENYKTDCVFKLESTKESYRKTCMAKYGVDHTLKVKSIRDEQIKSLKNRFGSYNNFREAMAASSARHLSPPNSKHSVDTKLGVFNLRSKLEACILEQIMLVNPSSIIYEPLIEIDNEHKRGDFLVTIDNQTILIEAKYHKYTKSEPYRSKSPKAWVGKYGRMWRSAQTQIAILGKWCCVKKIKFLVLTEVNKHHTVKLIRQLLLTHQL